MSWSAVAVVQTVGIVEYGLWEDTEAEAVVWAQGIALVAQGADTAVAV